MFKAWRGIHEYIHGLAVEASRTERVRESNFSVPLGFSAVERAKQMTSELTGRWIPLFLFNGDKAVIWLRKEEGSFIDRKSVV